LRKVLSEERRQWKRERALIEAEAQKTIAELKAPLPSLIDNHLEQVKERSACVKTEAMARRTPAPQRRTSGLPTLDIDRVRESNCGIFRAFSTTVEQ
jgi:hypothetical protein